jgi:hypothetical protein
MNYTGLLFLVCGITFDLVVNLIPCLIFQDMHAVQKSILILQCHEISHQVKKMSCFVPFLFRSSTSIYIGCFALYDTSSLFVTHTDVQYFLEDFEKNPKFSIYVFWKDKKISGQGNRLLYCLNFWVFYGHGRNVPYSILVK